MPSILPRDSWRLIEPRTARLLRKTGVSADELRDGGVSAAAGLVDLAYGDRPTPAFAAAVRMGIPAVDGLDVLVAQAAASFQWWTGIEPPLDAMAAAARDL